MLKIKFLIFLKKLFNINYHDSENKISDQKSFFGLCHRNLAQELDALTNQVSDLTQKVEDLSNENLLLRVIIERSIDIKKVPQAKGNLRKVQLIKTKLLELAAFILKQNNITFWADYGTLIGTIRHGGFIPWDNDIDISLLKEDHQKLPMAFKDLEKYNENFKFVYGPYIYKLFYKNYCVDFFSFEYIDKKYENPELADIFADKWYSVRKLFMKRKTFTDYSDTNEILREVNQAKEAVLGKNYKLIRNLNN